MSLNSKNQDNDILDLSKFPACLAEPELLTDVSNWHGHVPIAFALVQILRPRVFVELGTHQGDSYCAFCQAVQTLGLETRCFAVDTWEGDPQAGLYGPEVLEKLRAYHDPRYSRFSCLLQMKFDSAVNQFEDKSIDLLHIDGLHTYEAVKHDFETWLPKMSERGAILFHDTMEHQEGFGIWKFWAEIRAQYPHCEFGHSHGLGILAVGKNNDPATQIFFSGRTGTQKIIRDLFARLGETLVLRGQLAQARGVSQGLEGQLANLKQAAAERDEQITSLSHTVAERDGQITRISHAVAERDGQITRISHAVAERDGRITSLNHMVADRDGRITSLNHAVADRDGQLEGMRNSLSWRVTKPVRYLERRTREAYRAGKHACTAVLRIAYRLLPLSEDQRRRVSR
jgi:uncharacterized coiled-coil protein SlyX